ncbi:MAG: hypothetical protein SXQ77_07940, partial [Halobacteria archaeon]|nr:hypothetical protein [Halobacteria archaeon]
MTSLDTRALTVWILEVVGGGLLLGVGAVGIEMIIGVSWIKILAGLLVVLGAIYMVLRYRTWTFRIEDDSVYLEHGVFSRVKMV